MNLRFDVLPLSNMANTIPALLIASKYIHYVNALTFRLLCWLYEL